MSHIHHLDIG